MAKTILVVDDDANIRDTARDILEDAGYSVLSEGTAEGALIALTKASADVALLDFNLPDSKGPDLAVQMKQRYPHLVILLLTGESGIELGPAQSSIDSILTKPVDPRQLLAMISAKVD